MGFFKQVFVVTGGAQGIGRAITQAFARQGATAIAADVDLEAGAEWEAQLQNEGLPAHFIPTDVSQQGQVRNLFATIQRQFGRVDGLINNAAIGHKGDFWGPDLSGWERVLATNLTGPYVCSKYAAQLMKEQGRGIIINIASTRALMSEPFTESYSASKGGLLALTHSLAVSLGPLGIRVNAISPGWIEVGPYQKQAKRRQPDHNPEDREQHPVGRVGSPEDVAQACLFLASAGAGFITGSNLVVDGGMTVKMIYAE